jgi:chromosome segregation ATPase
MVLCLHIKSRMVGHLLCCAVLALQAELEALKTAVARERNSREAQQKRCSELEASLRSLTACSSEQAGELRNAAAAAEGAGQARAAAEAAAGRARQELRAAQDQAEAARRGQAQAVEEAVALQERVADMEASTAVYIAKEVGGHLVGGPRGSECGAEE